MFARSRARYISKTMIKTTRPAVGPHVALSVATEQDVVIETMDDVVSQPFPPKASIKYRMTRNGLRKTPLPPFYPINPLNHVIVSRGEGSSVLSFSDHTNTHVLTSTGHNTQLLRGTLPFAGSDITADPPGYSLAGMIMMAQAKAFARFDSPTQSYGEPIAELDRTIALISEPLNETARLTSQYRRRVILVKDKAAFRLRFIDKTVKNWRRKLRDWTRKKIARAWAVYSFGIAPLWRTIEDGVDLLAEGLKHTLGNAYNTVYGTQKYVGPLQTSDTPTTISPLTATLRRTRQIEVEVKAGIVSFIDDIDRFSTKVGTRARDIPVTAWELFPLSFLIDRVVNVKQVIRSTLALTSLHVKDIHGFRVVRSRELKSYNYRNLAISGVNKVFSQSMRPYFIDTLTVSRETWKPSVVSPVAPKIGSGLLSTAHKTLDLLSVIQLNLKS